MILHKTRTLNYETCKEAASHFKSRSEFSRGDSVAYRKCMKMKWIDDFLPEKLPPATPKNKGKKINNRRTLDYDTCRRSAQKANGRKDWRDKDYHAYNKARKNGWLEEFFPNKITRKSEITFELCKDVADKLISKGKCKISDLQKYNSNMYHVALNNGWTNKLGFQDKETSFKNAGLRNRKYSLKYAMNVAKKYTKLYDFRVNNYSLYVWCSKHDYMSKFTWLESQRGEYTEDLIRSTVAKYTDYTTFYKENGAMYGYMCRHKLLHLADSLERRVHFRDGYAVDFVYVYEFVEAGYAYVGRTVDPVTRDWDHRNRKNDSVRRFAEKKGLEIPEPKILFDNITVQEGPGLEDKMIEQYRSLGWKMINSVRGGSLGGMGYNRRWTMDALYDAASKFEYWDDFEEAYSGAIQRIRKLNIRDKFPWLRNKKTMNGKWKNLPKEEVCEIAKQFDNRRSFSKKYSALYQWAHERGWIDEWFNESTGKKSATGKKRVEQYSTDKVLVAVHESVEAAARAIGIKSPWLRTVCKYRPMVGKCKGFLFKYEDESNTASPDAIEAMHASKRVYREGRKEELKQNKKAWYEEKGEEIRAKKKLEYDAKVAAGYRYRFNKETGHYGWFFVGQQKTTKKKRKGR